MRLGGDCADIIPPIGSFAGAVEPQPRARQVGSEGPLPDWETPNEISGQNVPVTYSTKRESANPSHMTDQTAMRCYGGEKCCRSIGTRGREPDTFSAGRPDRAVDIRAEQRAAT
jgi:hypothetical protein